MQHEKTQLTQDGQLQFQIQKAERAFIALNHTTLEDGATLHEVAGKTQFTATLKGCLLDTGTQLLQKQQKNTALQIPKIDTKTH